MYHKKIYFSSIIHLFNYFIDFSCFSQIFISLFLLLIKIEVLY